MISPYLKFIDLQHNHIELGLSRTISLLNDGVYLTSLKVFDSDLIDPLEHVGSSAGSRTAKTLDQSSASICDLVLTCLPA